jgi:hypothetical protein
MHEVVSGGRRSGKTNGKIGWHGGNGRERAAAASQLGRQGAGRAELADGDHVCWLGNWVMIVQQGAGHSLVLIFVM